MNTIAYFSYKGNILVDSIKNICYIGGMKLIKLLTASGTEVYINPSQILSITKDPMNIERTILFLDSNLYYVIPGPVQDMIKLLGDK